MNTAPKSQWRQVLRPAAVWLLRWLDRRFPIIAATAMILVNALINYHEQIGVPAEVAGLIMTLVVFAILIWIGLTEYRRAYRR